MILDKIFKNKEGEIVSFFDYIKNDSGFENYIYTIAEAHAIDIIAKTIAKCEIQTFELVKNNIQKNKGDLYWTLNIQPNYNENGTAFIYKLVTRLLINNNALVLINEKLGINLLYVANSYTTNKDILKKKTFSDIILIDNEGNSMDMHKIYSSENSIYFSIDSTNLLKTSENFKNKTKNILKSVQKSFIRENTGKWKLGVQGNQPTLIDPETNKPVNYKDYKAKITEGLLDDEESIIMLSSLYNLENLNKEYNKTNSDYFNTAKNISDAVARKWNIPLEIFYGNKTDKSTSNEDFITFALDPYFELLEDGFNSTLVGKESYLKGEYVKFNRLNITHKDLIDKASGWDKLISNGFSFNQLSDMLGLPQINEEWANRHYITKNYANAEGGEEK